MKQKYINGIEHIEFGDYTLRYNFDGLIMTLVFRTKPEMLKLFRVKSLEDITLSEFADMVEIMESEDTSCGELDFSLFNFSNTTYPMFKNKIKKYLVELFYLSLKADEYSSEQFGETIKVFAERYDIPLKTLKFKSFDDKELARKKLGF